MHALFCDKSLKLLKPYLMGEIENKNLAQHFYLDRCQRHRENILFLYFILFSSHFPL